MQIACGVAMYVQMMLLLLLLLLLALLMQEPADTATSSQLQTLPPSSQPARLT